MSQRTDPAAIVPAPRRRGRFTPELVASALRSTHGCVHAAAAALECSPRTVHRYVKRHQAVRQALDEARELRLDLAELKLDQAIKAGEPWAVCFLLKTLGKGRGYVERQEHAGSGGGPLEIIWREERVE